MYVESAFLGFIIRMDLKACLHELTARLAMQDGRSYLHIKEGETLLRLINY